jgi:hypothetical protein
VIPVKTSINAFAPVEVLKMAAPKEILDLREHFDRNRETYRSGNYNEKQLRREFRDQRGAG